MIMSDPLHVIFLGIGRDFVSSVIKLLIRAGHFGGGSWDAKLHVAFLAFLDWTTGRSISINSFTLEGKLGFDCINGKATDIKLMIGWLAHELWHFEDMQHSLLLVTTYGLAQSGP